MEQNAKQNSALLFVAMQAFSCQERPVLWNYIHGNMQAMFNFAAC